MNKSIKINGKKIVEGSSDEILQKVLRKNGAKSVKLGCSEGMCGNCLVLLNDTPVPSCKLSYGMIQEDDELVTLSHFQKTYPEAKDISRGFEKAGINLCGYCDAGKYFIAYDLIKKIKPSEEKIYNSIQHLNNCCVDSETLCQGILYAYEFKSQRKSREEKSENKKEKKSEEVIIKKTTENRSVELKKQEIQNKDSRMIFPKTLQELFSDMERYKDYYISSGGTYSEPEEEIAELQDIDYKPLMHEKIISLKKIHELNQIEKHERYFEIGAAVPFAKILQTPRIPKVLFDCIKTIGSHPLRNLSTLGGNICIPDHKGCTWAALLALDARFEITSLNKKNKEVKKIIKAHEFTSLEDNEILTKIRVPTNNWNLSIYKRLGKYDSFLDNCAGIAFLAETERNHIYNIKIGFSGFGEISHKDEIFKHSKRIFRKRVKYGFCSDLVGQKIPLDNKQIESCLNDAEKIFSEKCPSCDPMIEQQFKTLLKSALESLK